MSTEDRFQIEISKVIPQHCRLEAPIKAGGQGAVFRGLLRDEPVAFKVFAPGGEDRRIEREIEFLAKRPSTRIVRLLERHQIEVDSIKMWFVAYELMEGGDLRQNVSPAARLDESALTRCMADISEAIAVMWQHRIVHRDIKPDNILHDDEGRFKLADMGLALHRDRSAITAAMLQPGTPGYMSPEQARGRKDLTKSSDLFSLGVTLWELATSTLPWPRYMAPQPVNTDLTTRLQQARPDLGKRFRRSVIALLDARPSMRRVDL